MCGLFGVMGSGISRDDIQVFKDLMVLNAIRGYHATGFVTGATWNNKYTLVKKAEDPLWFLQNLKKHEESDLDKINNNFLLGHTRWATTGDPADREAAQPFEVKDKGRTIIGTHNGTIDGSYVGFKSDSHYLFNRIQELGIENTIHLMKPTDKYAIVYYDTKEKKVKIIRNGTRELYFCYHPTRHVMYYTSEIGILHAALTRRAIFPKKHWYFKKDTLYTFDPMRVVEKGEPNYDEYELKPWPVAKGDKKEPWMAEEHPASIEGPSCDI